LLHLQFTANSAEVYRTASLQIFDSAQDTFEVPLSAAVAMTLDPSVSAVKPRAADFGYTNVGVPSTYQSPIQFINFGNGVVELSSVQITGPDAGDFQVYENDCPKDLIPMQGCNVFVQFNPGSPGRKTAYLSVLNDANQPAFSVLYGVAQGGQSTGISVTPASLSIGWSGSYNDAATVHVASASGLPFQILSTSIAGPNADTFHTKFSCGQIVSNQCDVDVFSFTNSLDPQTATLTINTTAGSAIVPLSSGFSQPTYGLRYQNPITITAKAGQAASYNEAIYQTGTQAIDITTNPTISGPDAAYFTLGTPTCNTSITACTLPILLSPSNNTSPKSAFLNLEIWPNGHAFNNNPVHVQIPIYATYQ
jgi:hypothetical protein